MYSCIAEPIEEKSSADPGIPHHLSGGIYVLSMTSHDASRMDSRLLQVHLSLNGLGRLIDAVILTFFSPSSLAFNSSPVSPPSDLDFCTPTEAPTLPDSMARHISRHVATGGGRTRYPRSFGLGSLVQVTGDLCGWYTVSTVASPAATATTWSSSVQCTGGAGWARRPAPTGA